MIAQTQVILSLGVRIGFLEDEKERRGRGDGEERSGEGEKRERRGRGEGKEREREKTRNRGLKRREITKMNGATREKKKRDHIHTPAHTSTKRDKEGGW